MSKKSRWLDGIPAEKKRAKNALSQTDRTDMGTVTEIMGDGNVAVHIDESSDPDVVAPVVAGVTGLGARVRLTRDSAGKVTQVEAPDRLPDGSMPLYVGSTGAFVKEISDAQGATRDALDAAKAELAAAKAKLEDPETGLDASQEKANDALAAAVGASQTAEKALDTAVLRIDSSRGLVFKNSMVSTVLTVTVIRGGEPITNIVDLQAAYGPGAYLEWSWKRLDESDFGVLSSADSRISQGGFMLTVSPADVDTKVVFMCSLNA